jgi:hypothetical protein
MQGGRDKIAAGIAKAILRTILRPTTPQMEIEAACSKNGFLEVPFLKKQTQFSPFFAQKPRSGEKTNPIRTQNEPNFHPLLLSAADELVALVLNVRDEGLYICYKTPAVFEVPCCRFQRRVKAKKIPVDISYENFTDIFTDHRSQGHRQKPVVCLSDKMNAHCSRIAF